MSGPPYQLHGLTDEDVTRNRQLYGSNVSSQRKESAFWKSLKDVITEPMFLLLLFAASIYLIAGETHEAVFMFAAIGIVSAISFYQDNRSRHAIKALERLTAPAAKVIRNGVIQPVKAEEIVLQDLVLAEEGTLVPADGKIIESADFLVNESILTGESFAVSKSVNAEPAYAFQGTQVVGGHAILEITAIGNRTELGRIGASLQDIPEEKTPLQIQISNFVRRMAMLGMVAFLLALAINYFHSRDLSDSLLKGLTLAMSVLPEEIPVAFSTFMALGAFRLMRMGVIVKNTRTVETLGSATVICADKTGTITENRMELAGVVTADAEKLLKKNDFKGNPAARSLIRIAMFASEEIPFDPMEKALHDVYAELYFEDERPVYSMVHEYPLDGKPPMMTHVFSTVEGHRVIAAKGAPEAISQVCALDESRKKQIAAITAGLASEGYRILGVAESLYAGDAFPATQQELPFRFLGLLAFYDPPKKGIDEVFTTLYRAGVKLKIISGDNTLTTRAIARQSGFRQIEAAMEASQLPPAGTPAFDQKIMETTIFTRMFPEAKLDIIQSLKKQGEIVAMTGDGVNDGPALKAAHISVAMGKRGSELARSAASLILTDDDFGKMPVAVEIGRRIYSNLKKAIQYIISIHIPIILTVLIPLVLGWIYPNIFTPVHVIFLELIMGPTCSIIYENEPSEANTMLLPPRKMTQTFLSWKELSVSFWQGLVITAASLAIYQAGVYVNTNEDQTRTLVFITLVTANIFLTLVNRSFYYSISYTLRYQNWMLRGIIALTFVITAMLLLIRPFREFFHFEWSSWPQFGLAVAAGMISVLWFEVYKYIIRRQTPMNQY
jgi:Ca2+-transporting ATPase